MALVQAVVPSSVPDFTGYGPLGATLVVVFLFLITLIWIVRVFVNDRKKRDVASAKMAESCHEVQRDTLKVLKDNGEFLGQNKEALNTSSHMMKDINETLIRLKG